MIDKRKQQIIDFLKTNGQSSSKEIFDGIGISFSYATLKRILTDSKANGFLLTKGQGKGTKYLLSPAYELISPIDIEKYYENEIDDRQILENFNSDLITKHLSISIRLQQLNWKNWHYCTTNI